jgi:rRNA maturation endonuclease Nob1
MKLFNKTKPKQKTIYEPYCPICEVYFEDMGINYKFCPDCGTKLLMETTCWNCKVNISGNHSYCPNCGIKQ